MKKEEKVKSYHKRTQCRTAHALRPFVMVATTLDKGSRAGLGRGLLPFFLRFPV